MTTDSAKKKAVRARKQMTGETYSEARRQLDAGEAAGTSAHFIADHCANCDVPLDMENQALFCTEHCLDVASFVRRARRLAIDPDRRDDPEVKETMRIRMAHLLGGGYSARERHLSPAERGFIIERDGGKCTKCGKPGSEIDHIAGPSNNPSNLQLLCDPCHNTKTTSAFVPASDEEQAWAFELYATPIHVEHAVRLCDEEVEWEKAWRGLKTQRAHRLWEQLENETDFTKDDFRAMNLAWADIVAEAYDPEWMPGERYVEAFEAGEDLAPAALEELQEFWYFQDQMAKDD